MAAVLGVSAAAPGGAAALTSVLDELLDLGWTSYLILKYAFRVEPSWVVKTTE